MLDSGAADIYKRARSNPLGFVAHGDVRCTRKTPTQDGWATVGESTPQVGWAAPLDCYAKDQTTTESAGCAEF